MRGTRFRGATTKTREEIDWTRMDTDGRRSKSNSLSVFIRVHLWPKTVWSLLVREGICLQSGMTLGRTSCDLVLRRDRKGARGPVVGEAESRGKNRLLHGCSSETGGCYALAYARASERGLA